jgi:glycosyltransferase involved in cell wall biosynthesis
MLGVGSLISRKNLQGAIDAATIVNEQVRLPLILVGSGHRGMQKVGIKLPASDSVQIPRHFTSCEELVALYRSAVCLLFPTFYEGFGLPAVEAMAYGCPVITSDIPVMREVCGDAALYCNPNRPDDIANKVKLLAASAEMQAQLSSRGLKRAAQFSWERCARETLQVLQNVIDGCVDEGMTPGAHL